MQYKALGMTLIPVAKVSWQITVDTHDSPIPQSGPDQTPLHPLERQPRSTRRDGDDPHLIRSRSSELGTDFREGFWGERLEGDQIPGLEKRGLRSRLQDTSRSYMGERQWSERQ
jgi:hypothetical protein